MTQLSVGLPPVSEPSLAEQALSLLGGGYWLLSTEPVAILHVSQQFYGLLGIPDEPAIGDLNSWLDRCHPSDREKLSAFLSGTEPATDVLQIRFRNTFGLWSWLEARCKREHLRVLVSFKDISQSKELETAAQESHFRYHSLYTKAPLAQIIWNREGLISGWNQYAEKLFGWQEPEVIGKKIHALLFNPEQKDWFAEQIRALLRHEGEGRFSSSNLTRDGVDKRCEWSNVALRNARGQLLGIMSLVLDVTEQWAAENQLRDVANMYRALVETSPDAILLTDIEGRVVMANQQSGRLFGYEHFNDLVGTLFAPHLGAAPQGDFLQTVLEQPSNFVGYVDRREMRLSRVDDTGFHAEISYTAHATPAGDAAGLIMIIRDISEQIQRNQELQTHRDHLETLVSARTQELDEAYGALSQIIEGSPVATFVLAADGTVTHWNAACALLMQTPAEQVIGQKSPWAAAYNAPRPVLAELVMRGDYAEIEDWYDALAKPSDLIAGAYEAEGYIPQLGRWLFFTAAPLRDKQGKVVGAIETLQDISARKDAEKVLIEARQLAESAARMKAEFLANMSHELRTPMNAVIGFAHLLQKTDLNSRQQDYVDKIRNSGRLLLNVVNDILDFSKIEAGSMLLEATQFSLEKTLDSVASIVQQPAQEKGLELHFVIEPEVPHTLVGDPLRLSQILTNLVSNAIKFTEAGFVAILVRRLQTNAGQTQLEFAVQDTGIGMSDEQASRLFQAFSQADASITRKFGGTGLGLVISHRLVDLMGGTISVNSQLGVGSTFSFTIWAKADAQHTQTMARTDLHALVVDDQAIARTVLVSMLNKQGVTVTSATCGEEALTIAAQPGMPRFDWLFLDWRMPDMSGTDLAARLRSHYRQRGQTTKVAMITAASPEQLDVALRNGLVDAVLAKPVFPAQLNQLLFPKEQSIATQQQVLSLQGLRVLVVEDIPTNQLIVRDLLESLGAQVITADHGQAAVDLLRQAHEQIDVVLMDVQMPVMDGLQATRVIRREISTTLPIIAMTAHAMDEGRQRCDEAGMNEFLSKPIDHVRLESLLQKVRAQIPARTSTSAAAPATDSPPQIKPEEWVLPGIDIQDGLRRMMHKPHLYEKVLRDFHLRFQNEIQHIKHLLEAHDFATAQRSAHSLKGLAGSISAVELFGLAKRLEHAITQKENIDEALQALIPEHQKVMQGIATQFKLTAAPHSPS